eukprot:m.164881 g.164881  ORF g.164881 m.164881 type:complete len:50 (+) comp14412_c0_seq2:1086-1235(+)
MCLCIELPTGTVTQINEHKEKGQNGHASEVCLVPHQQGKAFMAFAHTTP